MNTKPVNASPSEQLTVISPKRHLLDINVRELWRYRDLIYLFVKRDFIAVYKQTILGPLWFFIQPIFTTLIFTFVFGKVGKFNPADKPAFLYYLCGIILWKYFADCLTTTAETFIKNQGVFGKVYFPRIATPISVIFSNLLKLGVQFVLLVITYGFYMGTGYTPEFNWTILYLPLLIMMMAGMGMGFGLLISSMTTKYRDLRFLVAFGVQLLMYVTPGIIMSYEDFVSIAPKYAWFIKINPIGPIVETFKHGAINAGHYSIQHLMYSLVFTIILLFVGVIVFNKTEQNFMDTV